MIEVQSANMSLVGTRPDHGSGRVGFGSGCQVGSGSSFLWVIFGLGRVESCFLSWFG
jgi:hypothetical protein